METKDEPAMTFYDDFEPFCKWRRGEDCDTLELYLPGFSKNQLRVQLNRHGIITIAGDRPMDETYHHRIRFQKEIKISRQCKADGVRVRLENGVLSVVLPMKISNSRSKNNGNSQLTTSMPSSYLLGQWNSSTSVVKTNKRLAALVIIGVALLVALGAFVYNFHQLHHVH